MDIPLHEFITEKDVARFAKRLDFDGPVCEPLQSRCWQWTGRTNRKRDYVSGQFDLRKTAVQATHMALAVAGISVPKGMQANHHCDNSLCMRPSHIYIGTQDENVEDRQLRKRTAVGSRASRSKLTEADVIEIRRRREEEGASIIALALDYGIAERNMGKLIRRESWKHI